MQSTSKRGSKGSLNISDAMNDAGENRALEKMRINAGLGIQFEYTAPGTPQRNGRVERKVATLWASSSNAMYDFANVEDKCPSRNLDQMDAPIRPDNPPPIRNILPLLWFETNDGGRSYGKYRSLVQ
jgi:hypothetical protein